MDHSLDRNSVLDWFQGRKQVEKCGARGDLYQITLVHNFVFGLHLFITPATAVVNQFCMCSESISHQTWAVLLSSLPFTAVTVRDSTVVTATIWILQEASWYKHACFGSTGELMPVEQTFHQWGMETCV